MPIHLQLPNKENRKYSKNPICQGRHSGMRISDIGQYGFAQAMSLFVAILCPDIADRTALKEQEEEIHCADQHDDSKIGMYDSRLVCPACQPKEVDANRDFCNRGGHYVEEFANEDVLKCIRGILNSLICGWRQTFIAVSSISSGIASICAPNP